MMDTEIDCWLTEQLHASIGQTPVGPLPGTPRYLVRHPHLWRHKRMSLLSGSLPALLTTKAAAAAGVALLAAGGGVAAKTAVTGNPNPLNWGQTVTQAVQTCKQDLTAGQHGIGQCVSSTADQHGQQERAAHAPATPSVHPSGPPSALPSHPSGSASSLPAHPSGSPSSLPSFGPSSHPSGPPTSTGRP